MELSSIKRLRLHIMKLSSLNRASMTIVHSNNTTPNRMRLKRELVTALAERAGAMVHRSHTGRDVAGFVTMVAVDMGHHICPPQQRCRGTPRSTLLDRYETRVARL